MKHLIAQEHHYHLKKRAFLELAGFGLLIGLSINQREVLSTAVSAIRESDILYLLLMLGLYWIMLPLTAINYRMLAYRKIPLFNTTLSQLAAAGPGRIIPGGLGHISIAAVHLHKIGMSMQRAVLIPVSNNIIGMLTNTVIIILAISYHPTLVDDIARRVTGQTIFFIAIMLIALVTLLQWLSHARKTRGAIKRVNNQWKHLFVHLKKHPRRLLVIVLISIIITLGHAWMLKLAGLALNVDINIADAILALSTGVIFGGAIPTPGGVGAVEAGTTTALIVLGYDPTEATSVALLFRIATYWQPLLPGLLSYLYLREKNAL